MDGMAWVRGAAIAMVLALGCGGESHTGMDSGADATVVPQDAGPEPCDEPGAIETVACGMCGTTTRFCTNEGFWEQDPCEGEHGECAPGTSETVACGNCGSTTRRCTSECAWIEEPCGGEGECVPGTALTTGEGCPPSQQRDVICSDECTYDVVAECAPLECGTPGATETVPCGTMCGTLERVCGDDGFWQYGACSEEGLCVPGQMGTLPCGACGEQEARCSDACIWVATGGACSSEAVCAPGDVEHVTGDCAPSEAREATCDATCGLAPTGPCMPLVDGRYIVVPYMGTPEPARLAVEATAQIAVADLYFLMDITGSMDAEIDSMRTTVQTLVAERTCVDSGTVCTTSATCATGQLCSPDTGTCIQSPATGCIASLWTGAGSYEAVYTNRLSLQANPAATSAALSLTTFGGTEELFLSLLGMADPSMSLTESGCTGPSAGFLGCPAFRQQARRVAFVFTDEDSDGTTSAAAAGTVLADRDITLIGVWTSGNPTDSGRADLVDVVTASGSFAADGTTPLVFDGADAAVVGVVSTALDQVLASGTVRVSVLLTDDPSDGVDALQLVERVETNPSAPGCMVGPTEDADADGYADTFTELPAGARACFALVPKANTSVPAEASARVYPIQVTILSDGAPLSSEIVSFIVPSRS